MFIFVLLVGFSWVLQMSSHLFVFIVFICPLSCHLPFTFFFSFWLFYLDDQCCILLRPVLASWLCINIQRGTSCDVERFMFSCLPTHSICLFVGSWTWSVQQRRRWMFKTAEVLCSGSVGFSFFSFFFLTLHQVKQIAVCPQCCSFVIF